MALHQWRYDDPFDANSATNHYIFPRNPEKMTSVELDRAITAQGTPGGGFVLWEAPQPAKQWSYSGKTVDLAHYEALVAWHKRPNRFTVTDHFGRVITVAPLTSDLAPVTRPKNYWNHEYTITVLVLAVAPATVSDIWS